MASFQDIGRDCSAPSVQERITALFDHRPLFEIIAKSPQAGIYQRNGSDWPEVIAYIEGEVNQSRSAAKVFIQDNARPGRGIKDEKMQEEEWRKVMGRRIGDLLLKVEDDVVQAARRNALAPLPSMAYMGKYRANTGSGTGIMRAANGEMSSMYGQGTEPVHFDLAVLDREDLEPMAQLIADWIMDAFVDYVADTFRRLWLRFLSLFGKRRAGTHVYLPDVDARTISVVARAIVSALAILSLAVPIATLDTIQQPKLRIIVMALFGQAYAISVQSMGPRAVPLYGRAIDTSRR